MEKPEKKESVGEASSFLGLREESFPDLRREYWLWRGTRIETLSCNLARKIEILNT